MSNPMEQMFGGSASRRTKTVRCPTCDGTGKELAMGEETCDQCAGTGRDKNSDLWAEPCRKCNGKGRVSYCRRTNTCRQCNGSGVIEIKY